MDWKTQGMIAAMTMGVLAMAGAAPASAQGRHRGHDRHVSPVTQCVAAATRAANRSSHGGHARVMDIRQVERMRRGYRVSGKIAVNRMGRSWRHGDARYGRGWGHDHRGAQRNLRGYDLGRFTCKVRAGRVQSIRFSGIRGL